MPENLEEVWDIGIDDDFPLPNGETVHVKASATGKTYAEAWENMREGLWQAIRSCTSEDKEPDGS